MASEDEIDVTTFRSSIQHFTWLDYLVFVIMLAVCGGVGIYFGFVKKQTSTKDYLLGGRNMKLAPVCFSLVASFISGISLLGTPTELYIYGTSYLFFIIGAIVMCFILSYTFLPVLHELRLTSAYEYLERRYDKRVRVFGSVLFSVFLMAWLPIVIYVPALAFNQVTGVNIHIVTPIVCFVCIFYTCVGGLKAVVWTDVIQTVIMVGAMILVIVKGTIAVGGFKEVMKKNWDTGRIEFPALTLDFTERHSILSVSLGSTFYWIGNIAVNQSMMQRFLSLPDLTSSKRAVWGFLCGVIFIVLICAYSGLLAFARYYDCDPLNSRLALAKDQLLPLLVMDVLAEWRGMPGIFVAGVFSAALSSLSTGLNSMAAVVLEDFWKPFFKKLTRKQTQILIRAVVVILGVICVGLVFVVEKLGSVLQLTMSLSSASMGPLAGVFLMGIFLPFIDSTSALSGGILGLTSSWWLAAQSQIAQARGHLKFNEKLRYTTNCTYTFDQYVFKEETIESDVPYLYRISYLWFTAFGCTITVIIACLVSLRTSSEERRDDRLFAPVFRSWLAKKRRPGPADGGAGNTGLHSCSRSHLDILKGSSSASDNVSAEAPLILDNIRSTTTACEESKMQSSTPVIKKPTTLADIVAGEKICQSSNKPTVQEWNVVMRKRAKNRYVSTQGKAAIDSSVKFNPASMWQGMSYPGVIEKLYIFINIWLDKLWH